jgi:hypothetical protein
MTGKKYLSARMIAFESKCVRHWWLCVLVWGVVAGLWGKPSALLQAQPLQVQVVAQPLQSPYLSDYERSPGAMTVTVVNPTQEVVRFRIVGSLKLLRQNRVVVATKDRQTREFTVAAGGTTTLQAPDFLDRAALDIAPQDQELVLRTNRIPEGEYELCVSVVNAQTLQPLPTAMRQPVCRQFRTQTPQAPRLLSPQNGQAAMQPFPQFAWTPTVFVSGRTALYVVTVCKILNGQTPRQALEGNVPLVKSEPQQSTSFSYPATAEQLDQITDAASFVWQVQAVDDNGVPLGENNGKSEIFTFLPPKSSATKASSEPQATQSSSLQATEVFPSLRVAGGITADIAGKRVPAAGFHVVLQAVSELGQTVMVTETNAQGRFSLTNVVVKADKYLLRVKGRGTDAVFDIGTLSIGDRKDNLAFTITLPAYQAQITLTDADGKPVAGAQVRVSRPTGVFAAQGEPALNLTAASNSAGVAMLQGLLVSGNVQDFYVADITAEGYKPAKVYLQSRNTGLVSERVQLERAGLRVFGKVLQTNQSVANAVANAVANEVANAAVHLLAGGKTIFQSISDNDGTYTIDAPASVIAGLSAQARTGLSVVAVRGELRGEPVAVRLLSDGVEANPTLPASATTFTGLVVTSVGGKKVPLAGASVSDAATGTNTTTDGQGRFSLQASANKALVMVSRSGFQDKTVSIQPQGNEITLEAQGNWLQVTVLDAKTSKPLPNARVVLIDNAGTATTDAQGAATLKGFPQYARSLTVYAAGYGVETLDFLPASGLAAVPVTVRLAVGGVVMGTVKDESGKPVSGAAVSIVGYENVLDAKTDASGAFKLDNVPTGGAESSVRVVARAGGYVSGKSDVSLATGIPQMVALTLKKLPSGANGITSLAGFDVRIDAVQEDGANLVLSGVITNLKPSKLFASLVAVVNFQNVTVTKTSAASGNALPVAGKFALVEREIPMKFANEFPAKAKNAKAGEALEITLESASDVQGVLKGSVQWQFAEYVSEVAAGARANVEEVGILVAKPLLGKDGAEAAFNEEHTIFSPNAELALQSESDEYKAACQQTPTITIGGVTLAVVCDNFTVDVQNRNASFGARATLPENPIALDTITINPVKMGKTWGFQSADIQFSGAGLSFPLASSGWRMGLQRISITNTGVKIGGTITVSVAPSIPVNGITFTDVGVALGGVSGGTFTTSPNEFSIYDITKIIAPQLSVNFAGDSVTVKAANGRMTLADAGWQGLTIPTFQFTRRLDSLRRKPNLPSFNAPNVNVRANNLRRPSFPVLGKLNPSLLGIVQVELSGIDFNEQNELVIDGKIAFQFPGLNLQAGNFIFGKNKFVVGELGFRMDSNVLNAGMTIAFTPANRAVSPPTNARFRGSALVEIKKANDVFIGLAAAVMYESTNVWSVDFVANIPPIQLIPAPPPGVPIYLAGFGGGFERNNSDYRLSLQCTLQNAPTKPAPMDVTLGVTVWTSGTITGRALMNVVGEKLGDGTITMDVVRRDATGTINLGLTKGGVTATGSVNFGVWTSRKGDYFVDATTQLAIPSLLTANGRFYYGVETRTITDTSRIRIRDLPTLPPTTPVAVAEDIKSIGAMLSNMDRIDDNYSYGRTLPYSGSGELKDAWYRWRSRPFTGNKPLGEYTMDLVETVLKALPPKTATKQTLTQEELNSLARSTLQAGPETQAPFSAVIPGIAPAGVAILPEDFRSITIPAGYNWIAMIYGDGFYTDNLLNTPPAGNVAAIQAYDAEFKSAVRRLLGMFRSKTGNNSSLDWQTLRRGRRIYSEVVGRIAEVFWTAGISPRSFTMRDSILTNSRDVKNGKMIINVSANVANQEKSMSIGALGSVSFYGRGDGTFNLETNKELTTGSGRFTLNGATGFSVRVVKISLSGQASLNGWANLDYSPSSTSFVGGIAAQLDARATADGCCDSCTPSCNDYCTRWIYASVRACIGVNANFSYRNRAFSFDIARR